VANIDLDPKLCALVDEWLPYLPPHSHRGPTKHTITYERTRLAWLVRALVEIGVRKHDAIWTVVNHLDLHDPGAASYMLHTMYYDTLKKPWPPELKARLNPAECFTI